MRPAQPRPRSREADRYRRLSVALLAVGALLATREASAYCRQTACDASTEKCSTDENGCPRTGPPLSWRALPLTFRFHAPGSEKLDMDRTRDSVRRAFQTWSNVTCKGKRTSLRFEEGDDIPGSSSLRSKGPAKTSFGIYFRDETWPYDDGEESLALTNQTYGKINGYIDYAAIEVNVTEQTFRLADSEVGIDLQAVMTHEVGHYIGLAHSRVEGSIMAPSYCQSGTRCDGSTDDARALAEDDIAAVCALYPPSGIAGVAYDDPSASSCALGAGTGMTGAQGTTPDGFAFGSLVGLAAVAVGRQRRRR